MLSWTSDFDFFFRVPHAVQGPPPSRGKVNKASKAVEAAAAHVVKCRCDQPAAKQVVTKMSASKGREFWNCKSQGCSFFAWVDGLPSSAPSDHSSSRSIPAKRTISETKVLPDTPRVTLIHKLIVQLGQQQRQQQQRENTGVPPKCFCSADATRRVKKTQGTNHGKAYWSCGSHACGFFSWDNEAESTTDSNHFPDGKLAHASCVQ